MKKIWGFNWGIKVDIVKMLQSFQRVIYDGSNSWDVGQNVFSISPAVSFENGNISTWKLIRWSLECYHKMILYLFYTNFTSSFNTAETTCHQSIVINVHHNGLKTFILCVYK